MFASTGRSLLCVGLAVANTYAQAVTGGDAAGDDAHNHSNSSTVAAGSSHAQNGTAKPMNSTSEGGAGAKAAAAAAAMMLEGDENWRLSRSMVWAWIALIVVFMGFVCVLYASKYMRLMATVGHPSGRQTYFSQPNHSYALFRKHLYDAPLFRRRHHREFRLSKAIDMGTLPSRSQTAFVVGYVIMSTTLTCYNIDWSGTAVNVLSEVVDRSGYMAIMNMLPLFLLAARNNPLITWTGITFDTYNLIHRWLGRIVVLEALIHGMSYGIKKVEYQGGWTALNEALGSGRFIMSGFIGLMALLALLLHSPSPIRHAFYETFLGIHIFLSALLLGAVWVHLEDAKYDNERAIIKGTLAIWCIERGLRFARILYRNFGRSSAMAEVQALPGDCLRVKVSLPRPWRVKPGQHAYLYLPSISGWCSHPFTVAWSDNPEQAKISDLEKLPDAGFSEDGSRRDHNLYFLVRRRTGMTETLYDRTMKSPDRLLRTRILLEGPYSQQSFDSFGTVLLFAAGIGITHQLPHIRALLEGYANGTVATRKINLVWIIQSAEHLDWIREWMVDILSMPHRRDILRIQIYVTRPRQTVRVSPSSGVQLFPMKPNLQSIIDSEMQHSVGAVGVSVCGVGSCADDVRKACRSWMGRVNIEFQEESFSW